MYDEKRLKDNHIAGNSRVYHNDGYRKSLWLISKRLFF